MNAFDYFFEFSKNLNKEFLLNAKESLNYNDLFRQSGIFAKYLENQIGRNNNILLISSNSAFFIIAYLGIIKSENVVIPLNPEIEQANLDYIQGKCKAKLGILGSRTRNRINLNSIDIIDEVELNSIIHNTDNFEYIVSHTTPTQPAEIIFTSGSTGEPKGVMISHNNLIVNTESILKYLHLTKKDIMLVVLPFYYCYGLSLLHTHLRIGGSIVLNNMFIMLGNVINDLLRYNCTGFAGVPSHFQILLRKSDTFKSTTFPDLRYVTQAGGKLHDAFILEFIKTFPNIRFNVMYGQTEATARLSWLPPEKLPDKLGSCGKAIPDVELRIVDENNVNVSPGEIGEIIASGDNLMLGYYKDPESTNQVIKNGWLYTGDLARCDQEGYIYLTSRKKEIIKVNGHRVSPKEIEEVIVSMPEVIDCTVEGVTDTSSGESIMAKIIIKDTSKATMSKDYILKYLAARLASYKIPQIIEIKEELYITPTGKKIKNQNVNFKN